MPRGYRQEENNNASKGNPKRVEEEKDPPDLHEREMTEFPANDPIPIPLRKNPDER